MKNVNTETVKHDYLNKARLFLFNKYSCDISKKYNILKINDILTNEKSRIVCLFKDYLLYDEFSEFFKRYYNGKESKKRIQKFSNFYSKESFIYPNYAPLEEKRYVLSNIIKKQMLINKRKRNKYHLNNNNQKLFDKKNKVFNNAIYDDILGKQKSESFINELFEIDKEQNTDNENEEINKIINLIEKNENIYMKRTEDKIFVNKNNKYNIFRKNYSKNFLFKDNMKRIDNRINIENICNEETKDTSNINNTPYIKQKLFNYKSMIYKRKLNSTLSDNIPKIELPSNSSLVFSLKISNKALVEKEKNKNKIIVREIFKKNEYNKKTNIIKSSNDISSINEYDKLNSKKVIRRLTRNIQSDINDNNNTSIFCHNNKGVYIKNRIVKNNMSNVDIFNIIKDKNKISQSLRDFTRPYSKPKCINKDTLFNGISKKSSFNQKKEVILIERVK